MNKDQKVSLPLHQLLLLSSASPVKLPGRQVGLYSLLYHPLSPASAFQDTKEGLYKTA